jgi:hypothetical protein
MIRQKLTDARNSLAMLAALGLIGAVLAGLTTLASASGPSDTRPTAGRTVSTVPDAQRGTGAVSPPTATTAPAFGIASASGCTWAPHGYVCGGVRGSGLKVRQAYVVRGKQGTDFICDYRGRVTVRHNGRLIYSKWSSRHRGCTPLRAHFTFHINKSFPHKSKLCDTFYERGVRQGTVCFTIKR